MKKKPLSKVQYNKSEKEIYHITISLSLTVFILGIIILPWSNPDSPAFIPLLLSMIISFITCIAAFIGLKRQLKNGGDKSHDP